MKLAAADTHMTMARKKKSKSNLLGQLRERAELQLKKSPRKISKATDGDVQKLIHQLRVHQVELEMQNEELSRIQLELESSRDRFERLYDLSPVGYLTLDTEGVIREANLTAARLLDLDRRALLKKKLSRFIAPESQDDFYLHCRQVFVTANRQICELQMHGPKGANFTAHLETIAPPEEPGQFAQILVALSDVTRHRQAETALRTSEAQLSGIFRSAMDAIITVNSQQRIVMANPAAERMFRYSAGQLIGRSLKDLLPTPARRAHDQHIQKFGAAGVTDRQMSVPGKVTGLRADGTKFSIEATISQVDHAEIKLFTVILRDITERQRMEAEQSRLAAIVNSSSAAIISRTLSGTITSWNAGAEKLLGYSTKEALGRPFSMLVPASRKVELAGIERQIALGLPVSHLDSTRLTKDGRSIPVAVTNSPLRDAQGQVVGISTIMRDISERVKVEEALLHSQRELADFVDQAPLALFWVSPEGLVLRTNQTGRELLSRTEEECAGCDLASFLPDSQVAELFLEQLRARKGLKNQRTTFRRADGSVRHVIINANGLWDNDLLVHSRWFVRDISEREQLEREIVRITELEEQRFGRELHDDVCQQLSSIEFLMHGLERGLSANSRILVGKRVKEISRMLRQANARTRDLSHGLTPVPLERAGLGSALEALALRTRRVFQIHCRVHCPKRILIEDADIRHHLYRIAQEAVTNAVKHGRARRIAIDLVLSRRRLVLSVRDNGAGLPKTPPRSKGMGLRLMQYRAGLICGSLVVQQSPEGGTAVVCSVSMNGTISKGRKK